MGTLLGSCVWKGRGGGTYGDSFARVLVGRTAPLPYRVHVGLIEKHDADMRQQDIPGVELCCSLERKRLLLLAALP